METGACPYGTKCQFAHGRDELRPVKRHPKYKTENCRTFHTTGTCPYGKRCRFIHDPAERSVSPALTQMEADALELDIQRQLADLRLSLENSGETLIGPDGLPLPPQSGLPIPLGLLQDDDEYENGEEDSDDEVAVPPTAPVHPKQILPIQSAAPKQKTKQPEQQPADSPTSQDQRKKARLPFFQKLLSKKH